jgi:hypothetical protein
VNGADEEKPRGGLSICALVFVATPLWFLLFHRLGVSVSAVFGCSILLGVAAGLWRIWRLASPAGTGDNSATVRFVRVWRLKRYLRAYEADIALAEEVLKRRAHLESLRKKVTRPLRLPSIAELPNDEEWDAAIAEMMSSPMTLVPMMEDAQVFEHDTVNTAEPHSGTNVKTESVVPSAMKTDDAEVLNVVDAMRVLMTDTMQPWVTTADVADKLDITVSRVGAIMRRVGIRSVDLQRVGGPHRNGYLAEQIAGL